MEVTIMKKFFEDYKDLCKHSGRFYKDHWLGTLVFTVVGLGLSIAPFAITTIKENREFKKLKESYDEDTDI